MASPNIALVTAGALAVIGWTGVLVALARTLVRWIGHAAMGRDAPREASAHEWCDNLIEHPEDAKAV